MFTHPWKCLLAFVIALPAYTKKQGDEALQDVVIQNWVQYWHVPYWCFQKRFVAVKMASVFKENIENLTRTLSIRSRFRSGLLYLKANELYFVWQCIVHSYLKYIAFGFVWDSLYKNNKQDPRILLQGFIKWPNSF